jgi:hypothetical protein
MHVDHLVRDAETCRATGTCTSINRLVYH